MSWPAITAILNAVAVNVYDDENQLIELRTDTSATPTGSRWRTTWLYDGLGRARMRKDYYWSGTWTQNGETRYIYDGMRVIQERNSSNTPTVVYTRGNDLSGSLEGAGGIGGLLARSHGYSSGTWSTHNHYHADGNGNVTFLVNSGQTAEAWYRFDPYGRTMAQSATALTTENLYRFSSKEIHAPSGMYYYGFRFYDPHLQRWPNRDPLQEEAGNNLYCFIGNGTPNVVDALGLQEPAPKLPPPFEVMPPPQAPPGKIVPFPRPMPGPGSLVSWGLFWFGVGWSLGDDLGDAVVPDYSDPTPLICPRLPKPRNDRPPDRENCPLEDQHDMGPLLGYRCEYWCRNSGMKPVIYVPYAEGGCPKYIEQ